MPEKTVLAVDDDEMILEALKLVVEDAGFKFIGVQSGQQCLNTLSEITPKLIILDVSMAEMDGFETLERIRKDFSDLSSDVAFLTAGKDVKMVDRALKLGTETFILKPFNPGNLQKRIIEMMSDVKSFSRY